jgi:hypothetical protein
MVENNKHNYVTATYYLMLAKFIRNGGHSSADLRFMKKGAEQSRSDNLRPKI